MRQPARRGLSGCSGIPPILNGQAAIAKRQCAADYKLTRYAGNLRRRLGLKPGQCAPTELPVERWGGISADEAGRQKPGRDERITNR